MPGITVHERAPRSLPWYYTLKQIRHPWLYHEGVSLRELACLAGFVFLVGTGCSKSSSSAAPPVVISVSASVDAGTVAGPLPPLWRDHYDLSYTHMAYYAEPGFTGILNSLQPRTWRCSVGRWEVGYTPPAGGDSTVAAVLQTIDREFYRGANTLVEADNAANYNFTYLDAQLADLVATGAVPFLCFDYMPFTLSSQQNPVNGYNLGLSQPQFSFSNGIRTAPPADPAVYARVVRNTVRHVRGLFAGTTDYGIQYIEIGNEPDLLDGAGSPTRYFWTGTRVQWIAMYNAIAAEIVADVSITGLVKLGGGSFALQPSEPSPYFLQDFLVDAAVNVTRLDFVSYHSYGDVPLDHITPASKVNTLLAAVSLTPEVVNGEWGRALDGEDPVYDRIEHGLLRTKAMAGMIAFGVSIAHESIVRDVTPTLGNLGLIATGPAARKPVTDVYLALNLLNSTPQALAVTTPPDTYLIAGSNVAGTRVVLVYVGDDPGAGFVETFDLAVTGLPWGVTPYDVSRYEVSEATWSAAEGVKLVSSSVGLVGDFADSVTFGPGPGAGRLIVWELIRQ